MEVKTEVPVLTVKMSLLKFLWEQLPVMLIQVSTFAKSQKMEKPKS